jgi:hypothetical protein
MRHWKWKQDKVLSVLQDIDATEHKILDQLQPRLSFIKIKFSAVCRHYGCNCCGGIMAEGPVTLTLGQTTVASIDGYDQNGAAWTGPIPTPTWSIDQPSLDTITPDATTPANEDVLSVAVGVANLTVTVTNAQGTVLTDTEAVTNVAQALVLSSIKISFATPTGV